ncbi:hypothetical protein FRD01_07865 [Microvenator marinus]|uniref:Uncharacterized protein n=1 Tax=Microvenator marinus TaxID=2600177 RepID=A0A5B8XNF2_9DELT|nr:hypothetical protein [Microvenator marinus]QED27160.1 hypothetical protein FRD01_07865 [Microvenator marinus]
MDPLLLLKQHVTEHIEQLVLEINELLPVAIQKDMTGYAHEEVEVFVSQPTFDHKEQCFHFELEVNVATVDGLTHRQCEPCKIDRDRLSVGGEWGPIDGRRLVDSMRWEFC